jgi:hypothetical protein
MSMEMPRLPPAAAAAPPRAGGRVVVEDAGAPFCFPRSVVRSFAGGRGWSSRGLRDAMARWTLDRLDAGDGQVAAQLRASLEVEALGGGPPRLWRKEFRETAQVGGAAREAKRRYDEPRPPPLSDAQLRAHLASEAYARMSASEVHCRAAAAVLGAPLRVVMRPWGAGGAAAVKLYGAGGGPPSERSLPDLQSLAPARGPCVLFVTGGAHYQAVLWEPPACFR